MDGVDMRSMIFGGIYRNKKVVVTGNTGFKGSWLTAWLLRLGAKVYGISKDIPTEPSLFEAAGLEKEIEHCFEDVRNLDRIKQILNDVKPDFVFHLAAQPLVSVSYADPVETISTNVLGTTHILEALRCIDHPCCAIIITSDKCYDNVEWPWGYRETDRLGGKDIYSGSKGAAELVIKSYYHSFFKKADCPVRIASARAGNVIGGGDWAKDRIVPDCIRAWSRDETVDIRSPNATRPWQHVLEPLSGYLSLGMAMHNDQELNGESFNFGPLAQYRQTVKTLIHDLAKYWGHTEPSVVFRAEQMENENFHEAGLLKLNCDKALLMLSWMPALSYENLIEFTGKWYLTFYKGKVDILDITLSQVAEYETIAAAKGIEWSKAK